MVRKAKTGEMMMTDNSVQRTTVTYRLATVKDIDTLIDIDQQSFSFPWPADAFYNDLAHNRFASYVFLEYEGEVAGYCGVWVILDEAHITNIAVLPKFRGQKLGERLLRKMMSLSKEAGAKTMTLEVRVSNEVAKSLYKKLDFQEGGIRKKYYADGEDALVMWVNL